MLVLLVKTISDTLQSLLVTGFYIKIIGHCFWKHHFCL